MIDSVWETRDYAPLLRQRLPAWLEQRLDARATLIGLDPLSGGFSSESWKVKCAYQRGADNEEIEFVLRWGPPGGVAAPYDIPGQFALLERLAETPIPAPQPLWLEPDASVLGEPFLTMKLVPGRGIARYLPPEEPFREEKRRSHVRALAAIHALDWRHHAIDKVLSEPTPKSCARVAIQEVVELVRRRGFGDHPDAVCAIAWLNEQAPARSEIAFIHGDPNHSNYHYVGTEIVAIVDWEMAKLSDPLWDIAFVCTGMASRFAHLPGDVWERERQALLGQYQEETGRSLENLLFWQVLFTLRSASSSMHPTFAKRGPSPSQWPRLRALIA